MNKYRLEGGPSDGVDIQTDANISVRLYLNGNLYWVTDEVAEDGYETLRWEPIKPRAAE